MDINTIKNAVTCTNTGRRDTIAGVWSRQKRIRSITNSALLLETIVTSTFSLHAKLSHAELKQLANLSIDVYQPSLALLLCIVLGSAAKTVAKSISHKLNTLQTIRHVSQTWRYSCLLSEAVVRTKLMLISNEHIVMFRTTTNGDLCDTAPPTTVTLQHMRTEDQ